MAAVKPNVEEAYQNYCVEYFKDQTTTFVILVNPMGYHYYAVTGSTREQEQAGIHAVMDRVCN